MYGPAESCGATSDARSEGGSPKCPPKKSGVFSCNGLFHNSVLEYHIINFSKELVTNMKTPSLNFYFETNNFKEFCHSFWHFSCTNPPSERASCPLSYSSIKCSKKKCQITTKSHFLSSLLFQPFFLNRLFCEFLQFGMHDKQAILLTETSSSQIEPKSKRFKTILKCEVHFKQLLLIFKFFCDIIIVF